MYPLLIGVPVPVNNDHDGGEAFSLGLEDGPSDLPGKPGSLAVYGGNILEGAAGIPGCPGLTQETVVSQDGQHKRTRHTNSQGETFELVSHDYAASAILLGGHCYPGSGDQNGGEPGQLFGFGCVGPNAFTWGEVAMQFFIAHPRP